MAMLRALESSDIEQLLNLSTNLKKVLHRLKVRPQNIPVCMRVFEEIHKSRIAIEVFGSEFHSFSVHLRSQQRCPFKVRDYPKGIIYAKADRSSPIITTADHQMANHRKCFLTGILPAQQQSILGSGLEPAASSSHVQGMAGPRLKRRGIMCLEQKSEYRRPSSITLMERGRTTGVEFVDVVL